MLKIMPKCFVAAVAILSILALQAQAGTNVRFKSSSSTQQIVDADVLADPYAELNRLTFSFNVHVLDKYIGIPLTDAYLTLPPSVISSIYNLNNHSKEPLNIIFNLLAKRPEEANISFNRFLLNSIFGMGIIDWANTIGWKYKEFTADDLLIAWGLPADAYIHLPLVGPNSARSLSAYFVSFIATDLLYGAYSIPLFFLNGFLQRAILRGADNFIMSSLDPYTSLLIFYSQALANREQQILKQGINNQNDFFIDDSFEDF